MPRAVTTGNETERVELKSCPGGYVVLRRMTYGEFMERRQMSMKMSADMGGRKRSREEQLHATLEMVNTKVTQFEFAKCVVEHNLEDENDRPLDFTNPRDLNKLDPRIGEEIASHIDRMNQGELTEEERELFLQTSEQQ